MTWDPVLYLIFSDQRLRSALALLQGGPLERPARVVDSAAASET